MFGNDGRRFVETTDHRNENASDDVLENIEWQGTEWENEGDDASGRDSAVCKRTQAEVGCTCRENEWT